MLTKREREWLADSEKWNFKIDIYGISCFCPSCKHCEHLTETANGVFCQDAEDMWLYDKQSKCPLVPSKELLHEAAAFEGRVAEKLAYLAAGGILGVTAKNAMMHCRLAVEEEMDADSK